MISKISENTNVCSWKPRTIHLLSRNHVPALGLPFHLPGKEFLRPPQRQLLLHMLCPFLLTKLWDPQHHGGNAQESCLILPLFSVMGNFSSLVYFRVGALASCTADFQRLYLFTRCVMWILLTWSALGSSLWSEDDVLHLIRLLREWSTIVQAWAEIESDA